MNLKNVVLYLPKVTNPGSITITLLPSYEKYIEARIGVKMINWEYAIPPEITKA